MPSNSLLMVSIDKEFCIGVLKTLNTFATFAKNSVGLSDAEIVLHNQLWEEQFKKLNSPKDVIQITTQTPDDDTVSTIQNFFPNLNFPLF